MPSKEDMERISAIESVCAQAQDYYNVLAICIKEDGGIVCHSSIQYPPDILWAIEQAKRQIFECGVEYDD